MSNIILILNCGSSSLKFAMIDPKSGDDYLSGVAALDAKTIKWELDGKKTNKQLTDSQLTHAAVIELIKEEIFNPNPKLLNSIKAVGHRVVHGGEKFTSSSLLTAEARESIKENIKFAPLHNPAALLGIEAIDKAFPRLKDKQVAVFDTAYHQTIPEKAFLYAIPYSYYKNEGIRRYGFHGTSHYYVCNKVAEFLNKSPEQVNIINCHLGNGGSVCAIRQGKSYEISMGLTPLEGLVMGTRSGDIDPAIVSVIAKKEGLSLDKIDSFFNSKCGLLGITGETSDARVISDNLSNNPQYKLALDVYAHRVAKYIGSYLAILEVDHLDAITFTAGIGENAADFRAAIIKNLKLLGYKIDPEKNNATILRKSGEINAEGTPRILVVPTNEELVIAQDTDNIVK